MSLEGFCELEDSEQDGEKIRLRKVCVDAVDAGYGRPVLVYQWMLGNVRRDGASVSYDVWQVTA